MTRARLLALASLVLALSPACTKKNPKYCESDTDCAGSSICMKPAHECVLTDGGAGETRDGDAGEAGFSCSRCLDGGVDGGTVCDVDASMCVECLATPDCNGKLNRPICDARMCRACKADSECGPDPGICLANGRCAATGEVIFVDYSVSCPGTGGSASPFCTLPPAMNALTGGRNVIVLRGPADDKLILNTTAVFPVVIGKKNSLGADADIPAGGGTAISVISDQVFIRDLSVSAGNSGTMSRGVVVTGSSTTLTLANVRVNLATGLGIQADAGTQLTMDRCTITNNSVGGLLSNGAGYDIQNSAFVGNGYGVRFNGTLIPSTARFRFATVAGNAGNALTCDSSNPQTLSDSIVVGFNDACTLANSIMTMPSVLSGYHLTAHLQCPGTPAAPVPDHDIDGDARTPPLDCGADQFVP